MSRFERHHSRYRSRYDSSRYGAVYRSSLGVVGPNIALSASSVAEDAPVGTAVGTLSVRNGSGSYTFTITADPDSKFAINVDGVTLETADTLDYETATSHSVTLEADNGVDAPISRTFTISVTDVAEGGGTAGEMFGFPFPITKAA